MCGTRVLNFVTEIQDWGTDFVDLGYQAEGPDLREGRGMKEGSGWTRWEERMGLWLF